MCSEGYAAMIDLLTLGIRSQIQAVGGQQLIRYGKNRILMNFDIDSS